MKRIIRSTVQTIGYLIKIIWPLLWTIIKTIFVYTVRMLVVMFIGMPRACDMVASDLVRKAIDAGFPSRYEKHLYVVCYVIAVIQFLIGWIFLSWLTLQIIDWIF